MGKFQVPNEGDLVGLVYSLKSSGQGVIIGVVTDVYHSDLAGAKVCDVSPLVVMVDGIKNVNPLMEACEGLDRQARYLALGIVRFCPDDGSLGRFDVTDCAVSKGWLNRSSALVDNGKTG